MKKAFFLSFFVACSLSLFAQKDSTKQFILIVRFNPKMKQPTAEAIQTNIKHWNEFMGALGQRGQIVAGYRPVPGGKTITSKGTGDGAYYSNNESVSSFIIINAADLDAATEIAKNCPIFEFDGSVEVRPLAMTN